MRFRKASVSLVFLLAITVWSSASHAQCESECADQKSNIDGSNPETPATLEYHQYLHSSYSYERNIWYYSALAAEGVYNDSLSTYNSAYEAHIWEWTYQYGSMSPETLAWLCGIGQCTYQQALDVYYYYYYIETVLAPMYQMHLLIEADLLYQVCGLNYWNALVAEQWNIITGW